MSKLISDRAKAQVSNKALDILRNYVIDDWQSEPYHKHQNPAERRYQTVKQYTMVFLISLVRLLNPGYLPYRMLSTC